MRKLLELGLTLPVSAFLWLGFLPYIGATGSQLPPALLVAVICAYAVLTTSLFQFFYGAEILIGAGVNSWLVLAFLIAAELGIPFLSVSLVGLIVPGLVQSHGALALGVVSGFAVQFALLACFGPLRVRLDNREMHKSVTLVFRGDAVYLPGNGPSKDELLIIEPDRLGEAEALFRKAWLEGIFFRDWQAADQILLEAIPQLAGCGFLKMARLEAACLVLAQSFEASGDIAKQEEMRHAVVTLRRLYSLRGAN